MSSDLRTKIAEAYRLAESASLTGLIPYLQHLTIDCRPEPRPAREVYEPWQWGLASKAAPLFEHVAGINHSYAGPYNLWLGMPKGHSKTTFIAQCVNHTLAFSKRSWRGYCFAEDRDQAGLLLEAMLGEARLNPWLKKRLTFKNWDITGANNAHMTIEPADAASSQGIRPDIVVADEVCNWSDEGVWKSIVSGIRKRSTATSGAAFIVLTNAGIKHTWQWKAREIARQSPRWFWYEAPYRLASWMDEAAIRDDRALLPPGMAARLFDNRWMDPGEECGFVTRQEAEACALLGRQRGLVVQDEGRLGKHYFGALDFGSVKDYCVMGICHREVINNVTEIHLDRLDVLRGSRLNPVLVAAVRNWLDTYRKKFHFEQIVVDTHQLQEVYEDYSQLLPMIAWKARGGQENYNMAQVLRSLIVNKQILWPHGCGDIVLNNRPHTFVDELAELIIQPYANGTSYRVNHLPSKHDDRTVCTMMMVTAAVQSERMRHLYTGDLDNPDDPWW